MSLLDYVWFGGLFGWWLFVVTFVFVALFAFGGVRFGADCAWCLSLTCFCFPGVFTVYLFVGWLLCWCYVLIALLVLFCLCVSRLGCLRFVCLLFALIWCFAMLLYLLSLVSGLVV